MATTITFANSVGSIISVGDYIYATTSSVYTGQVTAVDQATNTITVDTKSLSLSLTRQAPYLQPAISYSS